MTFSRSTALDDRRARTRLAAAAAISVAVAVDQAIKRLLLTGVIGLNGKTLIPGLVDVEFAWNRGVSFSLLWSNSALGRLLLSAGAACIVIVLLVWALRTRRVLMAVAIGMVIGGALGNLVDRFLYGAVFDFLVMRIGSVRLFVCNLADVAITLGVVGVLIDALRHQQPA